MLYYKTEGITINQKPYRNTSQILTFYTRHFGKVKMIARGIHRHKHRLLNAPDLFSYSEIVFIKSPRENMNLLTEITLKDNFSSLREHLDSINRAFYVAEFLLYLTELDDPNDELFNLALDTLRSLSHPTPRFYRGAGQEMTIFTFQVRALKYLGFMPNTFPLRRDAAPFARLAERERGWGGEPPAIRARFACSPRLRYGEAGGRRPAGRGKRKILLDPFNCPICPDERGNNQMKLSDGAIKVLSILANLYLPPERLKITSPMKTELKNFLNNYVAYISGKQFNTVLL
ncbi:MAG: DNA repair protein RecO [Planctomycetota bacterium]|nr:DNA repair protein RecO [Planctomycetota bacterium]